MGRGFKKATLLFLTFLALWTPYRYLTGILGWKLLYVSSLQLAIESTVKLAVSFGLVYLFLRKYNDSWSDVGVKRKSALKSAALAAAGSLLLMAAYLALGGEPRPDPLGILYLFLVVGPAEELMGRGYYFSMIMSDFEGRRGLLFASLVSSLYFALSHIPIDILVANYGISEMIFHLSMAFFIGLILAGYYHVGDNLLGSSILHAMIDVCEAYISFQNPRAQLISLAAGMTVLMIVLILWAFTLKGAKNRFHF